MPSFLYQHTFGLLVVTKIGLAISLLCLILSILTFKLCRSIQGTRTTIHLHLCICLFIADLFFLAGISQTAPVVRACKNPSKGIIHFFLFKGTAFNFQQLKCKKKKKLKHLLRF